MRKGQAAMEYLMTYGWAILIVVVVVAALYAMGVFKIGAPPVPCSPCFSYFAFVDYAGGTLLIRNGAQEVNITSITASPDAAPTVTSTALNARTSPGGDITITNIDTTGDIDITITYTVVASGLQHTDTATIHNP